MYSDDSLLKLKHLGHLGLEVRAVPRGESKYVEKSTHLTHPTRPWRWCNVDTVLIKKYSQMAKNDSGSLQIMYTTILYRTLHLLGILKLFEIYMYTQKTFPLILENTFILYTLYSVNLHSVFFWRL